MTHIKIASNLHLPLNIITSRTAAMGGNGSGKTYFTTKLEEELIGKGGWVVILDPVGIHWGLRLDSTGQKPSKLNIPIFGGQHADVPIVPESGALIADLLCDRRLSAVLDVSEFSDGELNKFATDFGYQFEKRMKKNKRAVLLVMEEAQEFIPQNIQKGEEKKHHIYSRLAKIGRNYGVGILMVSQRPQDIAKKVFNLTQNMFAFQMTGLSERKAMEDWANYINFDIRISRMLPQLEVGCPFVASPRFLKFSGQVKILPKKTYDSSSTPDFEADGVETRTLSPIDISDLEKSMQGLIEKKKADDPAALRKEIARLQRELSARPVQVQPEIKVERVEVPIILKDEIEKMESMLDEARTVANQNRDTAQIYSDYYNDISGIVKNLEVLIERAKRPTPQLPAQARPLLTGGKKQEQKRVFPPSRANGTSEGKTLPKAEKTALTVLAMYPEGRTFNQLAVLSGYAVGKGFSNVVSSLRGKGYLHGGRENLRYTDEGLVALGPFEPLPTGPELIEYWRKKLPKAERAAFDILLAHPDREFHKDELATLAGYTPGKGFGNALSHMRTIGIAVPTVTSCVKLNPSFLSG